MKTTVWYLLVICLIKVKEMVNYIFAGSLSKEELSSAQCSVSTDSYEIKAFQQMLPAKEVGFYIYFPIIVN